MNDLNKKKKQNCKKCRQIFYHRSKSDSHRKVCLRCEPDPRTVTGIPPDEEGDLHLRALMAKERRLIKEAKRKKH